MTKRSQTEPAVRRFTAQWTESLARVLAQRTGQSPRVERLEVLAEPAAAGLLWWAQPFGELGRPSVWIGVAEDHCRELLGQADDPIENFRQLMAEAFADLAATLGQRGGTGEASAGPSDRADTVAVDLMAGLAPVRLFLAADEEALEQLQGEPGTDTMALLLDMELPVSVSFGKVQMAFQDVLKFAAGSIIELNRSVDDPVDIVVNEQVIASGEVVVVNGNYGVRIQRLASRAARLRSADAALVAKGVTAGAI